MVDTFADVRGLLFPTPNTPDLGCFVRREHEFELDANFHLFAEPPPFDEDFNYISHQVYFRIKCGHAAFYQRCNVYMRSTWDPSIVLGSTPDWVLGGDYRPRPSDWHKFSPQSLPWVYWFGGEHRNPSSSTWQWDAAVGHSFDIYENGTLSTVGWDDTGGDRDMNDLIVEVAVVYRSNYFDVLHPAEWNQARLEEFIRAELPGYQERDQGRPADANDAK